MHHHHLAVTLLAREHRRRLLSDARSARVRREIRDFRKAKESADGSVQVPQSFTKIVPFDHAAQQNALRCAQSVVGPPGG